MTKITKEPTGSFNPFYGCVIMVMAIMVFGGIVSWSAYTLITQDKEIGKFAVAQPAVLTRVTVKEADMAAFKARLDAFASDAAAAKPASLTLSVAELNTLIDLAPDTGNGSYKTMLAFKALKPGDSVVADVSLPVHKLDFSTWKFWQGQQYVVGEATFVVEIIKGEGPDMHVTASPSPARPSTRAFWTPSPPHTGSPPIKNSPPSPRR
jgi:hypothetical protein